jgi:flagellar hook-basal body complex protein FliE
MSEGISNNLSLGNVASGGVPLAKPTAGTASTSSFSDVLKASIDEVARLQQDASQAVQDLAMGRTEDVTRVMTAVEKSDTAFNMLLAIRSKLMDAYEEIKNIQI